MLNTVIVTAFLPTDEGVGVAADAIKRGELAVIPTETVYGLAANALDSSAVDKIFVAKGRPQDNPLIVHIADRDDLFNIAKEIPPAATALADRFWPGPLTIILKKSSVVPQNVTAGLDTVAVRMPENEIARAVIRAAGCPVAAPSANISGRPSITCAKHCKEELGGRVSVILESFDCKFGVESTVISLVGPRPCILRPGAVSPAELGSVLGPVDISPAVLRSLEKNEVAASPGMKYKHYSPNAEITIVDASREDFISFINADSARFALCFDEDIPDIPPEKAVSFGSQNDPLSMAHNLFEALRTLDLRGARTVFARKPSLNGIGLAVYNRLLRAAAFREISL